mgnify:CR=1 FL=1
MEVAYVRDAQLADVLVLSKTMRKADREEIMASNGVSALEALVTPFTVKEAMNFSIIGTGDEGVVGMFGCVPSVDPQCMDAPGSYKVTNYLHIENNF